MQEYGCGMCQSGNKPPKELQSKEGDMDVCCIRKFGEALLKL